MNSESEKRPITPYRKINYFLAGQIADAVITYTALSQLEGFKEIGPAGSEMISDDSQRLLIAKIAVTAMIIGLYAISRDKQLRAEFVGRKVMDLSTTILYLVLASNVIQVAPEVIKLLSDVR